MKTSHLELHTESLPDGILAEAHAHGTLDGADYDALVPELNKLLSENASVSFLLFMEEFHGWDIESMARELKWDAENRGRIRKVAVVGDQPWEKWAVTLSKFLLPGNVRYFTRPDEEAARRWVRSTK